MAQENPAQPENARPPRDNLFRAVYPGVELLRAEGDGDDDGPVMAGHFAVFNEWTEIDSIFEGNFLERFATGAFKKTIRENRDSMRVLFQHGFDYMVGDKPLGPIRDLREDGDGAYYEVPLLDASYVRDDVLPGLEAGLYGASFRFRVMREEYVEEPGQSDSNPDGLPERTVKEAQVREFGPVTFPAYAGASAGIRSLSDEFLIGRFVREPEKLRELIDALPPQVAGERATYRSEPACSDPEWHGTYAVRCGTCDACEEARKERTDTTSTPGAGDGTHPGHETDPAEERADNAPPKGGAGTESHPDHGSRGTHTPLYGQEAGKEKPSWLL